MSRVYFWLVTLVFCATVAAAQPVPPPGMPRDNAQPKAAGTATIRGHVVAADTGQPLRKAQVRITSGELRENRLTSTDADGTYEFKEVIAGRYNVSASKGSYVALQYGQLRPFEPGKPFEILAAQTLEKVDFALPKGAILTGRLLDEFGEPLPDAMVSVQRYQNMGGQRRLIPAGRTSMTNDIGEFRLFAVPPGQYYLSATLRPMGMGDTDDRSGYAPTYFPGTTSIAEAQKVAVGLGQIVNDINMTLMPTRVSRVTGTAVDSQGRPMSGMVMATPRTDSMMMMFGPPAQIKADGSFVVSSLAPGRYMLQVRGPAGDGEGASADITVSGDDVNGVRLVATKPSAVTGRVIVDAAAAQALRPSSVRLGLQPSQMDMMMMGMPSQPSVLTDDLTFEFKAAPGQFRVTLFNQPPGWAIRSVRYRGTDITDAGLDVRASEDLADVEVELTNRLTNLSGVVTNAKGEPVKDYSVIVFPQDRDKWTPNSRYMRTSRPDQDGRYKVSGVPPGGYLVIALDYLDQNEWNDPDFLEKIRSKATTFSVNEGETKTVDLKIITAL